MTSLAASTWWMTARRLRAISRQPWVLIMTLVQPMIWLFLFGSLFRKVTQLPGFGSTSYLGYLVPGVVAMSAVSSNMWSGMGVLEEIERGTLNRFLITPVRRSAIMNAAVIEQAFTTAIQSVLIVLIGLAAGAAYPGGVAGVAVLIAVSIGLGAIFSALSNILGMLVRQRESIIGMSVFLLLPVTFLSSAFMPKTLMPGWIQGIASANPVNWSLEAARTALATHQDWGTVGVRGGWLAALAALAILASTRTFRVYQKSI
jgi:ABC-2 type transport system permease protein